jgi:hypothetical protein
MAPDRQAGVVGVDHVAETDEKSSCLCWLGEDRIAALAVAAHVLTADVATPGKAHRMRRGAVGAV